MNIQKIMEILPHRYPFLLVDRVESMTDDTIVAIKNVTFNEPFFQGHFPQEPIMPGVLMIEALAQAGGLLAYQVKIKELPQTDTKPQMKVYFMAIDKAKFRKPVVPGDRMELNVTRISAKRDVWKMAGEVKVDGQLVCSCEMMALAKVEL